MPPRPCGAPRERGQVLVGVIMIMLVLLILIPALVQWTQIESRGSVANQKSTTAFNLAEAAVQRGYWKIQSTTQTWAEASTGTVIAGYNFDVTYGDVPGGTYRIKLSTAGTLSVAITGEGRDSNGKNTRAISAVFKSQTIYSPLMATQGVGYSVAMIPNWGPIMTQGSINLNDNYIGNMYFPRKFAENTVFCNNLNGNTCNPATNARDLNGVIPPNTDNAEWWSNYQFVPPLPVLDFAVLRASAAATGTLNVYGCNQSATHTDTATWTTVAGPAPWDGRGSACANIADANGAHADHFAASYNHKYGANLSPAANSYVWYYDHDVILAGDTSAHGRYGIGLHGTVIVRGNLTLDANGDYDYTGNVPVNAWAEYGKLTKTTGDTAAVNEYPADNGFQNSLPTFAFGTQSMTIPSFGGSFINTVGIRGFTYVGGNLTITTNGFMDFNGAVWVNGSVAASGASTSHFCGVYFDDTLTLPTLNVVLARKSWKEVPPSSTAWP
jgi:Tfp pilus assembly protein PilX